MSHVSIITPVYAQYDIDLEYFRQCLDNCVGQVDNVVVWDDGSPLSIESVVQDFSRQVTFLGGLRRGKSYARNMAVAACPDDGLIYPVDADDWLAPNTISALLDRWDGTPLYSDIFKVHPGNVIKPFQLLPFDCDISLQKCIAPVNVLHSKAQWAAIGGWDEKLNLFEDCEYNARLFWKFCAKKLSTPLVYYRQHSGQSTVVASKADEAHARQYLRISVDSFVRRSNMGCCGSRRTVRGKSAAQPAQEPVARAANLSMEVDMNTLGDPGPGRVWAKYFGGKGMGKHDRRGMSSRKKYKRVRYGGTYAVKAEDAVTEDQFRRGERSCGMVRLHIRPVAPTPAPSPPARVTRVVERKPVARIEERAPVLIPEVAEVVTQMSQYSIRELKTIITGATHDSVAMLLDAERNAKKPRRGAIKILEKELELALGRATAKAGAGLSDSVLNGKF